MELRIYPRRYSTTAEIVNIFKDIRTKLGLYLPLYSSNREFLVSNRRETAKIVKTLEIFRVYIPTEC